MQVWQQVESTGLELTEGEYGAVMQACSHGAPWDVVVDVLRRVSAGLTYASAYTLQQVCVGLWMGEGEWGCERESGCVGVLCVCVW